MDYDQAMAALRSAGTEHNQTIYRRHGVAGELFGVSVADLSAIARKIGRDDALARRLWRSANHDARVLACRVADPDTIGIDVLRDWANDLDNYILTDQFAELVAATPHTTELREEFARTPGEWIRAAGWTLVAFVALDPESHESDRYFQHFLDSAVKQIDGAENRVRHAMNQAVIAIGSRNDALRVHALIAAGKIGQVQVDHGQTTCKTPDAANYIRRVWDHRASRR